MKFTTSCFVRIDDADKRKELIEWLEGIGYECIYNGSVDDNLISCYGDSFGVDYKSHMGCLDCYTNIDLFKALAAMNDENDYMQWIVSNVEYAASPNYRMIPDSKGRPTIDMRTWWYYEWILHTNPNTRTTNFAHYHKATAEEIVEHFKTKES